MKRLTDDNVVALCNQILYLFTDMYVNYVIVIQINALFMNNWRRVQCALCKINWEMIRCRITVLYYILSIIPFNGRDDWACSNAYRM